MSGISAAIIGGSAITGYLSSQAQRGAAEDAAFDQRAANAQSLQAQQQNYQQGLNYQNNALAQGNQLAQGQQSQLQNLFAPYLQAGSGALGGLQQFGQGGLNAFRQQLGLAGANGADAQQAAIKGLQNSPLFASLAQQGEDAILQNASATGGLRGGNTNLALANSRTQLLNQMLQQQFANLGSLSSLGSQNYGVLAGLGQGSAGTQAQGGINILGQQLGLGGQIAGNVAGLSGANTQAITGLLGQQGQINANNSLAQGQADAGLFKGIGSSINLAQLLASGALGRGVGTQAATPLGNITGSIQGSAPPFSLGNITGSIQGGSNPLGELIGSWRF